MDVNLPDFDYKPPPHCKKKPWELKTRQYTDKEMLSCIEKVTSGHKTFREAVDGTGIRISSLYYKLKQLRNGGELRPPQGPKKKFTESTENEMAQYCEFCWEIGIPKTQDRFSQEMIHYMEYNGITNPFRTTQPGPGWFRRFRSEHPSVMFLRKGQEHKYKDDNIRHSSWVCDNIRFIRENNNGYLCWCPESIFIVEAQKLVWKGYQDFALWVVIPYNSCGQVIQPMIVHNGELNDKVQHYFGDKFRFIMSEDGELNYDASVAAVELIERYMDSFAIESPAVVYFDPNMARTICLCAWKSAWDSNILMRQIHRRIYEDKMTDCEKTIFCKIQPAFHRKMQTKIQTPQGFVQGLFEIISKCQYRQHMRTIFTQLNIITIEEQIRSDLDYPSNDQKNNQHTFVTNNPLPSHQQPQVTYTNEDGEYYYDLPAVSKAVPVNRYHSESNADVVHPSIDMAPCNFANQNGDEQTDDIPWGVMAGIYQLSHILSEGIDNCHSNTSPQLIDDSPPNTEASKQMVSLQSSGNQTAKENVSQDCDVVESIAELQCETLWSDFDSNEFDWAQEFDDLLPDEGYQNEITDIYQCHGLSPCITDDSTTHVQSAKDGMEASINVQGNDANNRSKVQVKLGTSAKKDGIDCLPTVQSFEAISPPQKLLAELRPNVQTDYQHEVSRYKSTNNHDNSPSQEPDSDPYAKFFGFDQSQMYLGWETISNKLLRIGRRTNNEHCQDD